MNKRSKKSKTQAPKESKPKRPKTPRSREGSKQVSTAVKYQASGAAGF